MDQGHSDLHAFNVRWIEALSSQPYWHQNDDRLPGLVGGIRGCLAQWWVTQMHHIVFVHYSAKEHNGGKCKIFSCVQKCKRWVKTGRVDMFVRITCTILGHIHNKAVDSRCSGYCFPERDEQNSVSSGDQTCQMQICPKLSEKSIWSLIM